LIAEDDLKFTSKESFTYFLMNEPKDYDIYLGGILYGNIKNNHAVSDFAGLTLYIIKQKFYNTFLSIPEGYDLDRSLANKGNFAVCHPLVVTQCDGFSDNTKKMQHYSKYLKRYKILQ